MMDDNLLAAYVICHNNWKFDFLRPKFQDIIDTYVKMHGSRTEGDEAAAEAEDADDTNLVFDMVGDEDE